MALPAVWSYMFGVGTQSAGYEAVFGRSCCRVPPATLAAIHHAPVVPCPPRPDKKSVTYRFFCHSFQNDMNCRAAHKKLRNKKGGKGGSNTNVVNRRGCRWPSNKALKRFPHVNGKKNQLRQRIRPGGQRCRRSPPAGRVLTAPWQDLQWSYSWIYLSLHWSDTDKRGAARSNHSVHICFLPQPQNVKGKGRKKYSTHFLFAFIYTQITPV